MTAIVIPAPIDALPPAPSPTDTPSDFDSKSFAHLAAQAGFVDQANASAAATNQNATAAQEQATASAASAASAASSATAAEYSAINAATSATNALASQNAAATSAADSEASRIAASKLNLGNKAAPPTVDNQGAALLAGATYYDTALTKWRVWTGAAWGDGISAISGVTSVNGMTGIVTLPPTQTVAYDNRAALRSQTPAAGEMAIVDGLGLFQHVTGSTEPDDDESCFATATGRWLLEAVHWDVVDAWRAPDDAIRDEFDEDEPLRFASKVLTGTATSAITSVAAVTQVNFTGTVTGAAVGDRVIATPPDAVGPRIAAYALVTAANTVTVYLNNPSAATQTIATGTWQITVIKP